MSVEATLVCDNCGTVIHAADRAAVARREAREQCGYQHIRGQDLCVRCVKEQYPSRVAKLGQ